MKTLQRYTAFGGISFLVVTIVAIGVTASTGLTEQALEMGDVENVLTIIAGHLGTVIAAMWLFNLANICMAIFGVGLAALLDEAHPWIRFASLLVVLSAAGLLLETTMTIGFAQGLAPAYASASGTEKAALSASALALIYFRDATALLAGVMVAVAGLLFGLAVLRVQGWPRWMGGLVLISGVLGLLGGFYPFVAALSFVRAISYLLYAFWTMVVGIKLLRS
jgi:hypothetical protein